MSTEHQQDPFGEEGFPRVEPNPSPAKTFGILNIVFGILLLLCVSCSGMSLLVSTQAGMGQMMQAQQAQMNQQLKADRQREVQALEQQEQKAPTPEEKARLQAQRKALEAQPDVKVPDFQKMYGLDDAQVRSYLLTDTLSAFVLDLAMIISGIGLVSLREWGRRAALWVAGLKVLRLVSLYSFYIVVIIPVMSKRMEQFFDEMAKAGQQGGAPPGAPGGAAFASFMGGMMTVFAVAMIVLGSIYPVIVLLVLSRPAVKAACAPATPVMD
jgi:hypothetical protein